VTAPAKILIVDDTPTNVKLLADLLRVAGYTVLTAPSGSEGLALVDSERPDLLLLDVMMPGMSGYEVCQKIRENPGTTLLPVVMVTSLDPSKERIKGLEAGADDFLTRPINQPELLARVRSLLRIKELYDTVQAQAAELADWNKTLEERVRDQVSQLERLGRLKRFFSPQLAELIVAGDAEDPLRSHRSEVTVVCLDLRGFTAFAETSEPEEVMVVLREFHAEMGRLVLEYEGTLERFTGDGMMIFFNDPAPVPNPAERAIRMALAMRDHCKSLAAQWHGRGYELNFSVGIAQGYATIGAIGFEGRVDYGAIGSVTTLAARLCEEARAGEILISPRVLAAAQELIEAIPVGELTLKGFPKPLPAFNVVGLATPSAEAEKDVFRREGEYWTVAYEGTVCRLRDSRGLHYIAHLLRHPEKEFHVADLVMAVAPEPVSMGTQLSPAAAAQMAGVSLAAGPGNAGELLDPQARAEYKQRLKDLRSEFEEATSSGDSARAARLREEIEFLTDELAVAFGLGGRARKGADAAERLRKSVASRLKDAVSRIQSAHPGLGRHLTRAVKSGLFCSYVPGQPVSWKL
jgi:class 3 adenylate cyclase